MTGHRWKQVKSILAEAIDVAAGERSRFLAQACGSDSALFSEVESLMSHYREVGSFLELPALEGSGASATSATVAPLATPGDVEPDIPDYEALRVCGRGAFGSVWIVKDRAGSHRAMKVIELGKLRQLGVPHREMKALQDYCQHVPGHPNLMPILHIGQTADLLYYTMELADNCVTRRPVGGELPGDYEPMTLRHVLEAGRLSTDTAVEIALRLLNGLAFLHRAGLIHRDIKPANVVFVQREVKLADISLVSVKRSQMSMAGTPQYMPPDEKMDATADTYAIGKVLYEMITGRDFSSFPQLPADEKITSTRLDIEKLAELLARSCASSAKQRFSSGASMHKALLACRFALHDSPLLELANREIVPDLDDSAYALVQLNRAIGDRRRTSVSTVTGSSSPAPRHDDEVVWAVFDRLIRVVPWLVLLILGLYLIRHLAA